MGELIVLDSHRRRRWVGAGNRPSTRRQPRSSAPSAGDTPKFYFDLACPFSYLAAERVERLLPGVQFIPVAAGAVGGSWESANLHVLRERASRLATALRLPLQWPDRFGRPCPRALRAASYAAEAGAGARFALAATRLAFCGGFDLEESSVIVEAALAACLEPQACLYAARDPRRDEALQDNALALIGCGVNQLPAVLTSHGRFAGEDAPERAADRLRPTPPVYDEELLLPC
jgi:2-hydroxychromene-2-carboxylate isomerase